MPRAHHPRRGRWAAVGLAALAATGLAACSSSSATPATTSSTSSTPTRAPSSSACALVSAEQVQSVTGTPSAAPTIADHGSTTTCTYQGPDPAQSTLIEYEAGASPATYTDAQQAFELKYAQTIPVSGLGDQAYVGKVQSGGHTSYSVVTLVGSTQIAVVSGAPLSKVESLAELVLGQLYRHSSRGSATTTTAGPAPAA